VTSLCVLLERLKRTLEGVLDDGDDTLKLFGGEVTSALVQINIGLLADQVGVSATDTRDLGQGVHDLLLSIDVCVQQTDDVLEAGQVSTALTVRNGFEFRVALSSSQAQQLPQFTPSVKQYGKFLDSIQWFPSCPHGSSYDTSLDLVSLFCRMLFDWKGESRWYMAQGGDIDAETTKNIWEPWFVVYTYLDFSPETSAVRLSACVLCISQYPSLRPLVPHRVQDSRRQNRYSRKVQEILTEDGCTHT